MRISKNEVAGIIDAIEKSTAIKQAKLYLYGSRTKADAQGGDIDLLFTSSNEETLLKAKDNKYLILVNIKENIGEQKIDLLINSEQDLDKEPFLKIISQEIKLLKEW